MKSFPTEVSHFSRNAYSKLCLSPDLSVPKIHRLFQDTYPDTSVNSTLYTKIPKKTRYGSTAHPCKDDKAYIKPWPQIQNPKFIKFCVELQQCHQVWVKRNWFMHIKICYRSIKAIISGRERKVTMWSERCRGKK
ncbi:hypothetical protein PR048_016191 [Dryococelus australis]|uniref:Uncharacterized protein n=1 Tax=Dryococelus australis TaxID=614101 RepID=A0ABQ9HJF8_9NEOP|nr:hypothetical protein PR048_016191 [Dryococelus australis]